MGNWKPFVVGFVGAITGAIILWVGVLFYTDHIAIKNIVAFLNQAQQRASQTQTPAQDVKK